MRSITSLVSSVLSIISVVVWMGATVPQILQNHKTKATEGISLGFLTLWLVGDLLNLGGCLLTNQLRFQTGLSVYFVCSDMVLLFQTQHYLGRRGGSLGLSPLDVSLFALANTAAVVGESVVSEPGMFVGDTVGDTSSGVWGRVIAWTCALVYVLSRLPQLYKNYQRRSTVGVSPLLFACTLGGNATYALSIISNPQGSSRGYFKRELPYILGSLGTVVADLIFFWQRWEYALTGDALYEMTESAPHDE